MKTITKKHQLIKLVKYGARMSAYDHHWVARPYDDASNDQSDIAQIWKDEGDARFTVRFCVPPYKGPAAAKLNYTDEQFTFHKRDNARLFIVEQMSDGHFSPALAERFRFMNRYGQPHELGCEERREPRPRFAEPKEELDDHFAEVSKSLKATSDYWARLGGYNNDVEK